MSAPYCPRCDSEDCRCGFLSSKGHAERPDGAAMLDEVAGMLAEFVAFPSGEARDAVGLWAAHAHCLDAFETTPRLALLSPVAQSGKTRTLEVLDMLTPEPMHAANLSAAALFRQVAAKRPTLLMDECDTYLGLRTAERHEDLRGLVNAGHRRGAVAYRCVGEPAKMEVKEFPAFAAVALAGIGDVPPTILDRSVLIKMRRRGPDERVEPFRERKVRPRGEALCAKIAAWAKANLDTLAQAEPEMPAGIVDRPADVWEPLLAIADAVGGEWPARARKAAVKLNEERAAAEPSLGIQLLADCRTVFDAQERLTSEELVARICKLEEAPWGDLRGKPIDARGVARRLKPFDVRPHLVRIGEQVRRGYDQADFHDAWGRYLPLRVAVGASLMLRWALLLPPESVTSVTDATSQVTGSNPVTDADRVTDANVTENGTVTSSRPLTSHLTDVTDVTPPEGRERQEPEISRDEAVARLLETYPGAVPYEYEGNERPLDEQQAELDGWNESVYQRARDERWKSLLSYCESSPSPPTVRDLARALVVLPRQVEALIDEHRAEWEQRWSKQRARIEPQPFLAKSRYY